MSRFLSKIKARLEPGQQFGCDETGWVRAALESMEQDMNPADLVESIRRVTLVSPEGSSSSPNAGDRYDLSAQSASQRLWETGNLDCHLPNGFFSIVPHEDSKIACSTLPTADGVCELDAGVWDILLVDDRKDKTLVKLKELCSELVIAKGFDPCSAETIRKIAAMVADFYGGPLCETGNTDSITCSIQESKRNVTMLGEVKVGLCRPRALLFKYLADFVNLKSRIVMGLQLDSLPSTSLICSNPKKHLTNVVDLKGKELLVDVMRHPGHLRPFTVKALVMYHISGLGDSDSAEYDSCDSPLEPNSPLFFRLPDKQECASPSRSEPDLTNQSWRHNRRKSMSEDCKSSPSPEPHYDPRLYPRRHMVDGARSFPSSPEQHPQGRFRSFKSMRSQGGSNSSSPDNTSARARAPSILSGSRRVQDEDTEQASTSSPDDSPHHQSASTASSTFSRRRSSSFCVRDGSLERACNAVVEPRKARRTNVPEISDDAARVVRAMKEAMKQGMQRSQGAQTGPPERSDSKGTGSEPNSVRLSNNSELLATDSSRITRDLGKDKVISSSSSYLLPTDPVLPFPEWSIDFSELRIGIRVGIGSFGEVFRGTWRGTEVAVKVMLEQDLTKENTEDFFNEISLLSRLRHPNVILFMGACTKPPHLSMVTEYMHMGSLYRLVHNSNQGKKLSWRRRLKMLRDICRGLMCVQRMNIIHRDLKSANCLVDKHWCVKICDFGLSRHRDGGTPVQDTTVAGTPEWMAPELLRNEPVTEKCDVFSLGVIIWELCTLRKPWEGVQPLQVLHQVSHQRARLEIPEGPLGRLISDCWEENPLDRPSFDEILTRLYECDFLLEE